MDAAPTDAAAEANRLYWDTDLPVGEIASRLDLSRRALYDAIRPVPATGRCARCGTRLEYPNRSSRDQGRATCRRCGSEVTSPPAAEVEPWTWSPQSRTVPPAASEEPVQSIWILGAAAFVGALLAAGATLALVRRS